MDRLKNSSEPWLPGSVEPPPKDFQAQQTALLDFPHPPAENVAATEALFRHCFVPRAVFSAQDARLCVRFFKLLIDLNTRHFDINAFLKVLCDSLLSYLAVFTQNEVTNYAQFVKGVMQLLRRWWQSEEYFKKEFCTSTVSRGMDHENFRVMYHQLHARLSYSFRDVFRKDVGYYLREGSHEMLGALLFWQETLGVYPHIESHHTHLTDFLKKMELVLDKSTQEKRSSLKASVLSILAKLSKNELCIDKLFSSLPLERGRRRNREDKKKAAEELARKRQRALQTIKPSPPVAPPPSGEAKANGEDASSPNAAAEDADVAPMEDEDAAAAEGEDVVVENEANGGDSPVPVKKERRQKSNGAPSSGRKRPSPVKEEPDENGANGAEPERKKRKHRTENGDHADGHGKSSEKGFAKPKRRAPKEEPPTPERWKSSPTPASDEDEDGDAADANEGSSEETSPRRSKHSTSSSSRRKGTAEKRPRAPSSDEKQRPAASAKKSKRAPVKRETVDNDEDEEDSDDEPEVVNRGRHKSRSKKRSVKKERRRSPSPPASPPPPPSPSVKREHRERERESSSRGGSRRSSPDRSQSRSRAGSRAAAERERGDKRERRKKRSPSPKRRPSKADDDDARRRRRARDHPREGSRSKRR